MSTTNLSKKLLVKIIAVVTVVVLIFGVAPVAELNNFLLSASAADMLKYDATLGSYTTATDANGNTVVTAVPNECCGFRGWYYKDGTEVSYNASYTLPSGASASAYVNALTEGCPTGICSATLNAL